MCGASRLYPRRCSVFGLLFVEAVLRRLLSLVPANSRDFLLLEDCRTPFAAHPLLDCSNPVVVLGALPLFLGVPEVHP